jgi:hypothetical protein
MLTHLLNERAQAEVTTSTLPCNTKLETASVETARDVKARAGKSKGRVRARGCIKK